MTWDKHKRAKWVEKRAQLYRMTCLKKTTCELIKSKRIEDNETYDHIITRIITTWKPPKTQPTFSNPEDKD